MHYREMGEDLQAWGGVIDEELHKGHLRYFKPSKREHAARTLREGWVLVEINYDDNNGENVRLYDDPSNMSAKIGPWNK